MKIENLKRKVKIDLERLNQDDRRTFLMLLECAQTLYCFTDEIMPQAGRLAIQDIGQLNRGLILGEKLFGHTRDFNKPK